MLEQPAFGDTVPAATASAKKTHGAGRTIAQSDSCFIFFFISEISPKQVCKFNQLIGDKRIFFSYFSGFSGIQLMKDQLFCNAKFTFLDSVQVALARVLHEGLGF